MPRLKTTARFVEQATEVHGDAYSYEKACYAGSNTKLVVTCKSCSKEFAVWPGNHLMGQGCPYCWAQRRTGVRKKGTTESFIAKAREVHGERFDYAKVIYKNSQTPVVIRCRACGKEFTQIPNSHVMGSGCQKCGFDVGASKRRSNKASEFIARATAVHGDAYEYSKFEYRGSKAASTIICKACGHEFQQSPDAHYAGKGCTPCATNRRASLRTKTTEEFVAEAIAVYGPDVFDYSETEYVYAHDPVKIRCCDCSFVFTRTPASHLQKHDCPNCCERRQVSKAESAWLDSLGVKVRQHRLKLPGRKAIIVDGYDPDTKTVYAFLGSFWHADPRSMPPDEVHPVIGRLNRDIHRDTLDQINRMKAEGYKVVHVWEYDHRRQPAA